MTGDAKKDSLSMFKHACDFFDCAMFCEKEAKNGFGSMNYMKPQIVNHAFSCEIFLKSILIYNGLLLSELKKCGHTLLELWNSIEKVDKDFANQIIDFFIEDWEIDDKSFFYELLNDISKAFEVWRYIYERHGASINISFLKWFSETLREFSCQKYYNMTWKKYSHRE